MIKKGYSRIFGLRLIKEIKDDIFNNKQNTIKDKIWSYRRGFLSSRINVYGLTEENYKLYLSDFDYYKLYPINDKFKCWIDDKLTLRYILEPFKDYLPKYYYQLKSNRVIKLMDCSKNYSNDINGIINLLKDEEMLAIKLIAGSLGKGFYKVSYFNNIFFINDKKVSEKNIIDFLNELDNYIVTEYIKPHKEISTIYDKAPNAMRLLIANEDGDPKIISSYIRFGTENSGMIEHIRSGGVMANIDLTNGNFGNGKIYRNGFLTDCLNHPDTGERIEGKIPNWELILCKTKEIVEYVPQLKYGGYDIVVTDDGFRILEINSHSGIGLLQTYTPLMKNKDSKEFFDKLLNNMKR